MKNKKKIPPVRKISVPQTTTPAQFDLKEWMVFLFIMIAGAVLLFFNLDAKYLWQDEAATAVLGERLLKFGKPLAYDGINLITMDTYLQKEIPQLDAIAGNADAAIRYYVNRGDFKSDTTWIGQPWGQFVIAGASIGLLGRNTLAARIPFSLAALLTVALLYFFVRKQFKNILVAQVAAAMLVANVYWVIHSRQCRYYSPSGLFLILTLMAFARWQAGRPRGGALFIAAAWCWFQIDYGTFWPMIAILLVIALITAWPQVRRTLLIGGVLGITLAPWIWYYQLFGRLKASDYPWIDKFLLNLFHMNQFLMPGVILLAAAILLWFRRKAIPSGILQVLVASLAMFLIALVWIPSVSPYAFYRYLVQLTPLAVIVIAWLAGEGINWAASKYDGRWRPVLAMMVILFLAFCPLLSNVMTYPLDPYLSNLNASPRGILLRSEWKALWEEVFRPQLDPNRVIVEKLKSEASPADKILVNYEDIPLMFYLRNPISGGISCFRVEDSSRAIPRFLVYRRSVSFTYSTPFIREINRYQWKMEPSKAPDIPWGDIPEPGIRAQLEGSARQEIVFAKNMGELKKQRR
jgi:4-amino-4-deoxy-L-arabinose transferase-like glycosyltransferase